MSYATGQLIVNNSWDQVSRLAGKSTWHRVTVSKHVFYTNSDEEKTNDVFNLYDIRNRAGPTSKEPTPFFVSVRELLAFLSELEVKIQEESY